MKNKLDGTVKLLPAKWANCRKSMIYQIRQSIIHCRCFTAISAGKFSTVNFSPDCP
jgi:hypothetical protein